MRGKGKGTYNPSKDGAPENEALKKMRLVSYDAAMTYSAPCLKRRISALQTRLKFREIELEEAERAEDNAADTAVGERDARLRPWRDARNLAELRVRELAAQVEGAIGAAIDRGLIELDE